MLDRENYRFTIVKLLLLPGLLLLTFWLIIFWLPTKNDSNAAAVPFETSMDNTLFRLASEQNDAAAQYLLGRKYYTGNTVKKNTKEAIKWFELAATQNHRKAQFQLGKMYLYGEGVAPNHAYALGYLRDAANNNYAEAQFELANYYVMGVEGSKDYVKAVKWYRAAAERQHIRAMLALGKILHEGAVGVPPAPEQAKHYLSLAAESGDTEAMKYLREIGRRSVTELHSEETPDAFHTKLDEASSGHIPSQYEVGMAYLKGNDGVDVNVALAAKWLRRAANNDHPEAQYMLSQLYRDGVGVDKNLRRSLDWLRIAATAGVRDAQKELQAMNLSQNISDAELEKSDPLNADNETTLQSDPVTIGKVEEEFITEPESGLQIPAKQIEVETEITQKALQAVIGTAASPATTEPLNSIDLEPREAEQQYALAMRYLNGDEIEKNIRKAAHWFEQAALQNHLEAQFRLGEMYKTGKGVTASVARAKYWLGKASDGGFSKAGTLLRELNGIEIRDQSPVVMTAADNERRKNTFTVTDNKSADIDSDIFTTHSAPENQNNLPRMEQIENEESSAQVEEMNTQVKVGMITALGRGHDSNENPDSGLSRLIAAANNDDIDAQLQLGEMYLKGRNVQRDLFTAAEWYEKAASLGNAEAQFNLGNMYKKGLGVDKNNAAAIKWYRKAANQGHEKAIRRLGGCRIC